MLDPETVRAQFPALALTDDGVPRIYFDNPGGTQVPRPVLRRTADYLVRTNANGGGAFRTSVASDAVLDDAHAAMADLLGAASPDEIVFGQNMTTLTFAMSRTLGRRLKKGDEVVVTRMDHDANVAPWLLLARDLELKVRWLPFDTRTYRYDLGALDDVLSERTAIVAVNHASNALGTINPVAEIARRARAVGALTYVDSVQYVPHAPVDVQALGCDFLVCSAYKFFGPHQGILWGREDLLASLEAYKVRPASDRLPTRHETGTLSHEGMAGTLGAVEYLESLGSGPTRRARLTAGMQAVAAYEQALCTHLLDGLGRMAGITVHGITDAPADRVPTVVFEMEGEAPRAVAERLAAANIFVWDGDYYAKEVIDALGCRERGGLVRVGLAHYNTPREVDRMLDVLSGGRA